MRIRSIAIGVKENILRDYLSDKTRKTVQICKTRAIGINREHRAIPRTAACKRSPIQDVVRQNQTGLRVAADGSIVCTEIIKVRKTGAVSIDYEYGATSENLPPTDVVPYSVLPDKTKPADGLAW